MFATTELLIVPQDVREHVSQPQATAMVDRMFDTHACNGDMDYDALWRCLPAKDIDALAS
jgi:hypothetical protein